MKPPVQKDPAMLRAILAAGGQTAVAKKIGRTQGAVSQWVRCPDKYAVQLEEACHGEVKRHELAPHLYPPPPPAEDDKAA